jgi:hypothetical protein
MGVGLEYPPRKRGTWFVENEYVNIADECTRPRCRINAQQYDEVHRRRTAHSHSKAHHTVIPSVSAETREFRSRVAEERSFHDFLEHRIELVVYPRRGSSVQFQLQEIWFRARRQTVPKRECLEAYRLTSVVFASSTQFSFARL